MMRRGVRGFTLVELMVTVTIMVIIGGTAYTSYNAVVRVYQKHQKRLETVQKCRAGLEQIARDLGNIFYRSGDENLTLTSLDLQDDAGIDQDQISFVRVIDPRYEFYQFTTQSSGDQDTWTLESLEEAEGTPVNTDLIRVGYMIGEDTSTLMSQDSFLNTSVPMAIYRITTHTLNYDDGISQALEGEITPGELAGVAETGDLQEYESMYQSESQMAATGETQALLKSEVLVQNAVMLDFKYFDGEEWLDTWEDQEGLPSSVMITLSTTDEKGEITITESTVVRIMLDVEAATEEGAAGGQTPNQGGSPGAQGGNR